MLIYVIYDIINKIIYNNLLRINKLCLKMEFEIFNE